VYRKESNRDFYISLYPHCYRVIMPFLNPNAIIYNLKTKRI
ncbi:hypothetical protein HMPREF3034_01154, partial [Prevotella sp. DNF00663]